MLRSCSVRIDGVFPRLCQHVRQLPAFVLALSPPLPSPWRNEKGNEGIHRTEWLDTRIWSPLLAPPLTIYFIPLGLIFFSIIINKITTEASSWTRACVRPCFKHMETMTPRTKHTEAFRTVTVILQWGEEQKESSTRFPLSVFPTQCLSLKILCHMMAVKGHISTARKGKKCIVSIFIFISSFETVL